MLFLAVTTVKATLVLLAAFALAFALRRASAAVRHSIWTLALLGVLLLPMFSVMLARVPAILAPLETFSQEVTIHGARNPATPAPPSSLAWSATALYVWLAGALAMSARLAIGAFRVSQATRHARPMETPLTGLISSQLGLQSIVTVAASDRTNIPLAWGIVSPVILLPADSRDWTEERTRIVLSHELAHIKRHDCLTQILAQLVCALYWFHPLMWFAARQLRKEREQACDDRVLTLGHRAADYADHLVELAATLPSSARWSTVTVAMARPHELEARVVSLLDPRRRRKAMTRLSTALCALAASALILPLSTLRAPAQARTGIGGSVYDVSGAAIPAAALSVSNLDTGSRDTTVTNEAGEYALLGIPAGRYLVEVRKPGFALFQQRDVKLEANTPVQFNATLEIGSVSESLEVVGERRHQAESPRTSPPSRVRVGGNVQATKLIFSAKPRYPDTLQQQGVEGTVLLRAIIAKDGGLVAQSITVANALANPELASAAIDAVKQWRYEPTLLNGQPVEVATTITLNFKLH